MRNLFRGYYHATEAETEEIWRAASIALDANVLLSLYKVSPTTSTLYLTALEGRKEQGWIPYQAALEFHRNVHAERARQTAGHSERIQIIGTFLEELRKTATKSRLEKTEVQDQAVEKLELLKGELEQQKSAIADATNHHKIDELLSRISSLYDGRVGEEPTQGQLDALYVEGQERFEGKIPPGFEDEKSKPAPQKYGDFILWKQLMEYAKAQSRDIIFVTDDDKSDWWLKDRKVSLVPRPELVQEFRRTTGREILIYNSQQFYRELFARQPGDSKDSQAIQAAEEDMKEAVESSQWVEELDKYMLYDDGAALRHRKERARLIRARQNRDRHARDLLNGEHSASEPLTLGEAERLEDEFFKARNRRQRLEVEYHRALAGANGEVDFEVLDSLRQKILEQSRIIDSIDEPKLNIRKYERQQDSWQIAERYPQLFDNRGETE